MIRIFPTTPLRIFCKIILNSKVIVKSSRDPDDNISSIISVSINRLSTPHEQAGTALPTRAILLERLHNKTK